MPCRSKDFLACSNRKRRATALRRLELRAKPRSPINLASGPRTAYGHGLPSERKVGAGDFIMVEFGGAYRRYGTTVGRHACAGEPSNRMQELHDLVLASCDACINAIRPGVRGAEKSR